jgi:hypothetical protein
VTFGEVGPELNTPMKYHHLGIPTTEALKDEIHLRHLKMYVSGYGKNPYGVEWVRYEDDAPYPELVKTVPHIAFEVENLAEAIQGKNVIIQPNSPLIHEPCADRGLDPASPGLRLCSDFFNRTAVHR